jgi:hypothetical protein
MGGMVPALARRFCKAVARITDLLKSQAAQLAALARLRAMPLSGRFPGEPTLSR